MEARLTSRLVVDALVRTCFLQDMPAFVVARGDADRGAVVLKVNRFRDGVWLLEQARDFDGARIWRALGPKGQSESEADDRIQKKRRFDSDLWVVEIEDIHGRFEPDAPVSDL